MPLRDLRQLLPARGAGGRRGRGGPQALVHLPPRVLEEEHGEELRLGLLQVRETTTPLRPIRQRPSPFTLVATPLVQSLYIYAKFLIRLASVALATGTVPRCRRARSGVRLDLPRGPYSVLRGARSSMKGIRGIPGNTGEYPSIALRGTRNIQSPSLLANVCSVHTLAHLKMLS